MDFPTVTARVASNWLTSHEDNTDYRMLLLRHCKNGMRISGIFGMAAVTTYVSVKLFLNDYEMAWQYTDTSAQTVVMIDKLIIFSLSALVAILSKTDTTLTQNRTIVGASVLICAFAILSDDILNQSVDFSGGHLVILLLLSASCIPFRPWQVLTLGILMSLMLNPGLRFIPAVYGVDSLSITNNQTLHFTLVVFILVGVNLFLHHSRYATYTARRKAEGFIDSLNESDETLAAHSDLYREKSAIESDGKNISKTFVSYIDVPSADQKFLDSVKEVIEEHMGDSNFGVEWLAHEVAISPRQLQRKLKGSIGLSAGSLIRVMRIQRAAQLLEQNAGNITEIAYSVGFKDSSYFSRLFKKMHGVNPSEYPVN